MSDVVASGLGEEHRRLIIGVVERRAERQQGAEVSGKAEAGERREEDSFDSSMDCSSG
jgi:hypothetical protein